MPQTQQGKRQQWFRDVHGKPGLTYSGDIWEAANSLVGPIGTDMTVNGALLLMAKDQSGYAGNDLPGALQAWADASGEYNWSSKGAFYPFFDFRSSIPDGWTHTATDAATQEVVDGRAGVWAPERVLYYTNNGWGNAPGSTSNCDGTGNVVNFNVVDSSFVYRASGAGFTVTQGQSVRVVCDLSSDDMTKVALRSIGGETVIAVDVSSTPTTVTLDYVAAADTQAGFGLENRDMFVGAGNSQTGTTIIANLRVFRTPNADEGLQTEGEGAVYFGPAFAYRSGTAIGVQVEPQGVELALHNRDLSNVVWTPLSGTATKTATGADGVANSASVLTATGADASFSQTFVLGALARTITVRPRRVTGTGVIRVGDGTTATDVTSQLNASTYVRVADIATALANPKVVIDIVTSGDVIEADFVDLEDGTFSTSDIPTGAAQVMRPKRSLTCSDLAAIGLDEIDGVFRVKGKFALTPDETNTIYDADNGTTTDFILISRTNAHKFQVQVRVGGVDTSVILTGTYADIEVDYDIYVQVDASTVRVQALGEDISLANAAGAPLTGLTRAAVKERVADGSDESCARGFELISYQPGAALF